VIALGNAYGYEHTVTRGIISALRRDVEVSETQTYKGLIQTDASINPGNSGGPLINIEGDMIGLNVAVHANAKGIGFAIPIDRAMEVAAELMSIQQLQNKWHGIVSLATDDPEEPLIVESVQPNSPAEEAGLRPGDRIHRVGDLIVARPLDVERAFLDGKVGQPTHVDVVRNGESLTLELALASRSTSWEVLGLDLSEEPRESFQKRNSRYRGGMRVVDVRRDGPAAQEGIQSGDVLIGMNGWETASAQDVDYIVTRPNLNQMAPLKFYVLRGKSMLYGHLDVSATASVQRAASQR
jgi:serine protease Do